jgi:hypothetical protein
MHAMTRYPQCEVEYYAWNSNPRRVGSTRPLCFIGFFVLLCTHCAVLPAVSDYYRITVYYLDSSGCMITTS